MVNYAIYSIYMENMRLKAHQSDRFVAKCAHYRGVDGLISALNQDYDGDGMQNIKWINHSQ